MQTTPTNNTAKQGNWTDEQWEAVITKNKDILVAAAAGSGKTAVLVERIIRKITDACEPVDIDRLLVVTFTNAAAAEMRHRIGDRLEKALREYPESIQLQRQLALLNKASISTLHSFCLDVVKKFYYSIQLDPNFRIADDTEAVLLRDEILDEILEQYYGDEGNIQFQRLADCYASDRSDMGLREMILKLYDYSRSHPSPKEWLSEIVANYDCTSHESLDDVAWVQDFLSDIRLQLQGIRCVFNKAREVALLPDGPNPYLENIDLDLQQIERLYQASCQSWSSLYQGFQELTFSRLKTIKQGYCDAVLQQQAKDLRDQGKKKLTKLNEDLFMRSPEDYLQDIYQMAPIVTELAKVVNHFADAYRLEKAKKGLVDFSDLEHYCLEILRDSTSLTADCKPSEAGLYFQKQYSEILIDEYQDTNLVQETIINLITSDENYRFMVGDVKQSVYRFRLAEPELFLSKYKLYNDDSKSVRIDLAKNFRSRSEVIHCTNYIFKQVMDETVGEIAYDEKAQLEHGATYYPETDSHAELLLIDRAGKKDLGETQEDERDSFPQIDKEVVEPEEREGDGDYYSLENADELQVVQLESRVIAQKIKELMGQGQRQGSVYQVFDKELTNQGDGMRNIQFRDIVILLRASASWAAVMIEELKQHGVPAYADLTTGYFSAIEVKVMMSLLKIIDNPCQDIPLAAVLRSPIVGLCGEELGQIRLVDKLANFYDSMKGFIESDQFFDSDDGDEKAQRLRLFYEQLQGWRTAARQGSLSELIWRIFRETGYYDFVGGMVGGVQRQANLRALYDRARAYEKTSFRGLFRFLHFIERMQQRGGDLGTARSLGEQEDVVRIMTIHKSKGLEFPVVFVAGLGKQFNLRDVQGKYLIHKKLGFGTIFVDPEARVSYPLLSHRAISQRIKMEQLAEEMRILYVALTRAREKLYLLGSTKNLEKEVNKWGQHIALQDWILPDYGRASGKTYLDWIGPAILRHREADILHRRTAGYCDGFQSRIFEQIRDHQASWKISIFEKEDLVQSESVEKKQIDSIEDAIQNHQTVPVVSDKKEKVVRQLEWEYPLSYRTQYLSKQTVSGIKKNQQQQTADRQPIVERPLFMQGKILTAAERGTIIHLFLQHVDTKKPVTLESLQEQAQRMIEREFMKQEQVKEVDLYQILAFYQSEIGLRLCRASMVQKEIPFSLGIPAETIYSQNHHDESSIIQEHSSNTGQLLDKEHLGTHLCTDRVLIQGVIDCIFEDEFGLVLLDYKSDRTEGRTDEELIARYQLQVDLYSQAVEQIWKRKINERYLYFFEGSRTISSKK